MIVLDEREEKVRAADKGKESATATEVIPLHLHY